MIAEKTGEPASSYAGVAAAFSTLSVKELQKTYDGVYGAGRLEVSDLIDSLMYIAE